MEMETKTNRAQLRTKAGLKNLIAVIGNGRRWHIRACAEVELGALQGLLAGAWKGSKEYSLYMIPI